MQVVVVGAEGFIGKELQRRCRIKNIEVVGIDIVPSEHLGHIQMDIRSQEIERAIPQDVDILIHLAAISRHQDCLNDVQTAFDINVNGTLNLMRAAQARRVKQFIFASSEWVYGGVRNADVQTEESAIDANRVTSAYALTKIIDERLLRIAHLGGFCPVTVLRFGIVYGPRPSNWSAVEALFHAVRTQETVTVGSLMTARRFIHVSDIAEGILSAFGQGGFEILNISGDRLITLREVIEQSARILGRRPQIVEQTPQQISIRNPDNRKAREILGWKPTIDLVSGLQSLLEPSGLVTAGAR